MRSAGLLSVEQDVCGDRTENGFMGRCLRMGARRVAGDPRCGGEGPGGRPAFFTTTSPGLVFGTARADGPGEYFSVSSGDLFVG